MFSNMSAFYIPWTQYYENRYFYEPCTGKSRKLNDEDMVEMQKFGIRHSPDGTWTV